MPPSADPLPINQKMASYSTITGAQETLTHLLSPLTAAQTLPLPAAAIAYAQKVRFTGRSGIVLPCVFREVEAAAALKALEAGSAAAIAELRYGIKEDDLEVDMDKAAAFLLMVSPE